MSGARIVQASPLPEGGVPPTPWPAELVRAVDAGDVGRHVDEAACSRLDGRVDESADTGVVDRSWRVRGGAPGRVRSHDRRARTGAGAAERGRIPQVARHPLAPRSTTVVDVRPGRARILTWVPPASRSRAIRPPETAAGADDERRAPVGTVAGEADIRGRRARAPVERALEGGRELPRIVGDDQDGLQSLLDRRGRRLLGGIEEQATAQNRVAEAPLGCVDHNEGPEGQATGTHTEARPARCARPSRRSLRAGSRSPARYSAQARLARAMATY